MTIIARGNKRRGLVQSEWRNSARHSTPIGWAALALSDPPSNFITKGSPVFMPKATS
jgi:hypothetical protein